MPRAPSPGPCTINTSVILILKSTSHQLWSVSPVDAFGPHVRISVAARRLHDSCRASHLGATLQRCLGRLCLASSFRGLESWLSSGPRPISRPAHSLPQDTQTFHFSPRGRGGQGLLKPEGGWGGRRLLRPSSLSRW